LAEAVRMHRLFRKEHLMEVQLRRKEELNAKTRSQ